MTSRMGDAGHISVPTVRTDPSQGALTFVYLYGWPIYAYALFEIPEFDDRYWLWPWYDMYGNNFANVSSLQGFKPGKYLLRYTEDNFGVHLASEQDEYRAYVNSPTPYGMLLNRMLVKHWTSEDLSIVHSQQGRMLFTPKARGAGPHKGIPPLDLQIFLNLADSLDIGQTILSLTALLSRYNPPEVVSDRAWIAVALEKAGISSDGTFTQPEGTDLSLDVARANTLAATSRNVSGLSESLCNSWT
ncbi:protein of unknown function DUF1254 [Penicillium occitanis (nom. inval.)]|nr:protein of unknown function DUF1254 [Penicillium occitanis (nom. inval.)]PCH06048.1 hypothetical protein PENOC_025700 [Penicillium occitanis (nom. inval.)]